MGMKSAGAGLAVFCNISSSAAMVLVDKAGMGLSVSEL
jgi:hypothetical protein